MINPISEVFDATIPSLSADEKRPFSGFVQFANQSVELERFQRQQLAHFVEDNMSLSAKLYTAIMAACWYGFESGKNYVINGGVERMLALEDECYRARMAVALAEETKA